MIDKFVVENHPFGKFTFEGMENLIIGTFPSYIGGRQYEFFYSGSGNLFWKLFEAVYDHKFSHNKGSEAVRERKSFLEDKKIGITDMHQKCYRRNNSSRCKLPRK